MHGHTAATYVPRSMHETKTRRPDLHGDGTACIAAYATNASVCVPMHCMHANKTVPRRGNDLKKKVSRQQECRTVT